MAGQRTQGARSRAGAAYDLAIVGGGTAGLVAAVIAGELGARVALIERAATGGDCLWTGCVPSKALIASAGLAQRFRTADRLGLEPVEPRIDFSRVMDSVRAAREQIAPHDSPERLRRSGVEVIEAEGRLLGAGVVGAGGRRLAARAVLIATGSRPLLPCIPGLAASSPLTTDTLWEIDELPRRLVVLGGGATGCELAQAFARLGSKVTLVEAQAALLANEEPEAQALVARRLREEGVDVRLDARVTLVESGEVKLEGSRERASGAGAPPADTALPCDRVLAVAGRRPVTEALGLETVGVALDQDGAVRVDRRLRTTARGVYAAGDVIAALPFTHVAAYHARVAVTNALFRVPRSVDYSAVPWVTFTDPEVARVGMSEAQARSRFGSSVDVELQHYAELDRAVVAGEMDGFAKLVSGPRGRLVGATIVAPSAGEAVAELAARIASRGSLAGLAEAVHAYPTFAEGPVRAAEERALRGWKSMPYRALTRSALVALRGFDRALDRGRGSPARTATDSRD